MNIEQRTPVPALGDGWFLLGRNETIQKGDMFDATCLDGGWVDVCTCIGRTLETYPNRCRAARYFGHVKEPQPAAEAEPQPKPIDWTKPVRTKDGRAVRVLCTDGPGDYPVVGFIDGVDGPECWHADGRYFESFGDNRDLENAPQRIQREYWVNVYEDSGYDAIHDSSEHAAEFRNTKRKCLGCVKITIDCEEGEGL